MTAAATVQGVFPALFSLATVAVLLRLYCKHTRGRPIRREDHVLLTAWFFLLASLVHAHVAVTCGYAAHLAAPAAAAEPEPEPELETETGAEAEAAAHAMRFVAVCVFFAVAAGALGKTSVGLTLLRVLQGPRVRRAVWFLTVSVNMVIWAFSVLLCVTVWSGRLAEICGTGGGLWGFAVFGAVWSALTDFTFVVAAWPVVWRMQRATAERVGLGVGMSGGAVSGVLAIVKITQMRCSNFEQDITHHSVPLVIWTFAEPVAIVVAASVPNLRLFCEKPTRTILGRPLVEADLAPSHSFTTLSQPDRRSVYTVTGGPFDGPIALQTLHPGHDRIVVTDQVVIGFEENTCGPARAQRNLV